MSISKRRPPQDEELHFLFSKLDNLKIQIDSHYNACPLPKLYSEYSRTVDQIKIRMGIE